MGDPRTNNVGAYLKGVAGGGGRLVAAGTGDATAITGQGIDRKGYGSAKVLVGYHATLADTKTLAVAAEVQYSADNSSFDTAVPLQTSTVAATGVNPTTAYYGVVVFNIDLTAQKRYFRINVTPDLNASGTDVAEVVTSVVLGGADALPAV